MRQKNHAQGLISSIPELHQKLNIKDARHEFISIIPLEEIHTEELQLEALYINNFYTITCRTNSDIGIITCAGPGQVVTIDNRNFQKMEGFILAVHPGFFPGYFFTAKIKGYGFFSYAANEALHLSIEEADLIVDVLKCIDYEISARIEENTHSLIMSYIDLLLNYCDRFYKRQFISWKHVGPDVLDKLDTLLNNYFESATLQDNGLPSVQYISNALNLTPNYLSDMLRAYTGKGANQHIQDKAIEKAKELLLSTNLSVAEISYKLGFGYPQSFNKFFKRKTKVSPQKYRLSARNYPGNHFRRENK